MNGRRRQSDGEAAKFRVTTVKQSGGEKERGFRDEPQVGITKFMRLAAVVMEFSEKTDRGK